MAAFTGKVVEETETSSGQQLWTYATYLVTIFMTYGIMRLYDQVGDILIRSPEQFVSEPRRHRPPTRRSEAPPSQGSLC